MDNGGAKALLGQVEPAKVRFESHREHVGDQPCGQTIGRSPLVAAQLVKSLQQIVAVPVYDGQGAGELAVGSE